MGACYTNRVIVNANFSSFIICSGKTKTSICTKVSKLVLLYYIHNKANLTYVIIIRFLCKYNGICLNTGTSFLVFFFCGETNNCFLFYILCEKHRVISIDLK